MTQRTAFCVVVEVVTVPVSDAGGIAIVEHVNRDAVVVHARGFRIDTSEPAVLAAPIVQRVLAGALATVTPIVALKRGDNSGATIKHNELNSRYI